MSPGPNAINFSEGSDVPALRASLAPLLAGTGKDGGGGGRWTLTITGDGIERSFKFKTFAKTWDFMTAVSLQCKIKNHHPEWSNVYNTTFIRWTTHKPKGLSALDLDLAALCDSIARDFGEVVVADEEVVPSCKLQDLATSAVEGAGGSGSCCVKPPGV